MSNVELHVELLQYPDNPEKLVAMAARLCYSASDIEGLRQGISRQDQSDFVNKLMAMGHLSPVEHAAFTFGVEGVSRSLLAQITRHRIASFSVKSQRYVTENFKYIIPPRIAELGPECIEAYREQMATIQNWYDYWLDKLSAHGEGAREDARFVLPNATETKLIVTMNTRELYHFFNVRCCNRAQWEIRALAREMLRLVRSVAPVLFSQAGPRCLTGQCPEKAMSCKRQVEVREEFAALK
ncbi:MAG: FAD-dependent thymidylate synthase [Bacillota bacterium]